MGTQTLRLIEGPPAEDARVVAGVGTRGRALLTGGGRSTMLCGGCGFAVCRRVDPGDVIGLVLRCPRCCRYNTAAAAED